MSNLKWSENWNKSYRITIGTREYQKQLYTIQQDIVAISRPLTDADEVTVPSDARILSNLEEDGKSRRGFTFKFDGVQSLSTSGSNSEKSWLTLYNLDEDMIKVLNLDNCLVIIECGYGGQVELAYSGDVVEVLPHKEGSDDVYRIKCASGAQAMRNTTVSTHYDESLSQRDVIIDMVGRFPGTALGSVGLEDLNDHYRTGGNSFVGTLVTKVDNQMAKHNLSWSHFNGKIVIVPFRLKGEDYNHFSRTNYNIPAESLKSIKAVSQKQGVSTEDSKSKLRHLQVNTFFIPVELGQFITIPDETYTENFSGTYQVKKRRLVLQSKGNAWDVVLEVEEV